MHGHPRVKTESVKFFIKKYCVNLNYSLMIGDSKVDYEAARSNGVKFILRCTKLNADLQKTLSCKKVKDFNDKIMVGFQ